MDVKNISIPRTVGLIEKYLVDMVYLNDGMRIIVPPPPTTMMLLKYARENSTVPKIHFMGLAAPILRGRPNEKDLIKHLSDDRMLAIYRDRRMRRRTKVDEFFYSPIREKLEPSLDSLIEEFGFIENHENKLTIFMLRNVQKNKMHQYAFNMLSVATKSYFPYLDNDFVEYCLSIPPMMKQDKGILPKIFKILFAHSVNDGLHFKTLKKMCPEVMKISSTRYPVFSRFYLSTLARSKNQKKKLFKLLLQHLKHHLIKRRPLSQTTLHEDFIKKEFKYMIDLLKSLKIPPFINGKRLLMKTQRYLKDNKDPSYFLIPLLEFCIWYNLFIYDIPPSEITRVRETREDAIANSIVLTHRK